MVDDLTTRQILELSAQGTPSQEISAALSIEPAFVNLVLAGHGQVAAERDIDDEQLGTLRRHAFKLALQNEDLGVSAKMTRFLIERDKPRAITPSQSSPLANINQAIILAQSTSDKLLAQYFGKPQENQLTPTTPDSPEAMPL